MRGATRLMICLCAVLLLGGCEILKDIELPKKGSGTDEMKRSPCACAEIDYNAEGFEWIG